MQKLVFLLCAFLVTCPVGAQDRPKPVFENEDVVITPLEEGVWVAETSDKTTMYLIEGNDRALLFDTGTQVRALDSIVRCITRKPLCVVLSHGHYDHAGGIGYFDEIRMHPADTVLLMHLPPYAGRVGYVHEGDVFDLGGRQLEAVEMPAHTPGSIVLMDREAGICYAGDAFGSGQVWLQVEPTLPLSVYLAALKKMQRALDEGITRIYCGHYPYQHRPLGRAYLDDMERLVRSILDGAPLNDGPFDVRVGIECAHPRVASYGSASIVYDPSKVY